MLKISIIENDRKRQLVLEGKLVAPWTHGDHPKAAIEKRPETLAATEAISLCWHG